MTKLNKQKTEWEKELRNIIKDYFEVDYDNDMAAAGIDPPVDPIDFIRSLLSHQRQEILDQVEEEVIGEDEFEMPQKNGTGIYPDTKERYANQLRAEFRKKLSAIRGGKK